MMTAERLHSPGIHKKWNESFYFNWYDQKQGICSFTRIGFTPNIKQKNMFLFLCCLADKNLAFEKTNP